MSKSIEYQYKIDFNFDDFFMGLRVLFGKDFGARRHEKSMQLEVEHEQKTLKSL